MGKKGAQWEREICTEMSEWWSDGRHSDLFWRSSMSGGRATVRGRKGKRTTGHYGDVAATSPAGAPLTKAFTIELKRGYGHDAGISGLLDRPNGCGQQTFEAWIQQADMSAQAAGALGWLIISRRNQRSAVVYFERRIEQLLTKAGAFRVRPFFRMSMNVTVRYESRDNMKRIERIWYPKKRLVAISLHDWYDLVSPAAVKAILKNR